MSFHTQFEIELPKWLESFLEDWPDPLTTAEQRIRQAAANAAVEGEAAKVLAPNGHVPASPTKKSSFYV